MPTKRELEVNDPHELLGRIRSEFPDLQWSHYEFLNHGWDHEVIILDGRMVFRFPNSAEYLRLLKDEIGLLDYLDNKINTRIPKYTYIAKDYSFGGYELIGGEELTRDIYNSFSENDKSAFALQLADFVSKLHGLNTKDVSIFNITIDRAVDDFADLRVKAGELLKSKLGEDDMATVNQILDEVKTIENYEYNPTLLHADLSSSHILWDGEKAEIGIIDFSDRIFGDPALDFAELYYYGNDFVDEVYRQYAARKDPDFLLRAKIYYRRIAVFLLVDSFLTDKISFDKAKQVLERVKKIKVA